MKQDVKVPHHLVTTTRKRQRRQEVQRHRWLDQWMVARGEPLRQLTRMAVNAIEHYEQYYKSRQRARRADDLAKHHASIDVIVVNLAYAVLVPAQTGRVAVKKGGQRRGLTRYDNPALGPKPLRRLIDQLSTHDFLSLKHSTQRGEVSSIAPTEWFKRKVRELGIGLSDFGRDDAEELIVLTRNSRSTKSTGERVTERDRIDYTDTVETERYRNEVRGLNAFLASANIEFIDDGQGPLVNPFDRRLRRHFVILPKQPEKFDQVGRLFGSFWLALKSARRSNIRINGEPVADLDFGTMFTRLAYGRLRATPPEGDLYALEGTLGYRSGIKLAMNTFLFDTNMHRSKWPREMGVGVGTDADARNPTSRAAAFEARLPTGWTVGHTRTAILKRHPALRAAWGAGLGYQLMFDESRILLASLGQLVTKKVPALGMHDGLLVQRSKKDLARAIMEQAARDIAGLDIPVEEKG